MRLIYLVIFLFSFSSASLNSINTDISKLEESKEIWLNYKTKSNNSYIYFTNFISWSGFGHETEIEVKNGVFIQRKYTFWNRIEEDTWIENQKDLGKHKQGGKLKFIDDLYEECKNILETKSRLTNYIYLDFDKKGLLSNCLYAHKNCADDCSNGIQIKEIKFTK
jgi:hypothetical protein